MQHLINSFGKILLSLTLTFSLLFPSLVVASLGSDTPGGSVEGIGGNETGIGDGGGASSESDGESDTDSDTESAAETAAADAAEVADAAAEAGLGDSISVEAADVVGDPDSLGSVTVNGVSVDKASALSAISAMSAAMEVGISPASNPTSYGIDVDATFSAHAAGCDGCVVGNLSGPSADPTELADAERTATISVADVVSGRNVSNDPTTARISDSFEVISGATSLNQALGMELATRASAINNPTQITSDPYGQSARTTYSGPRGVPSQGLNTASLESYARVGTYSYNPSVVANPGQDVLGGWVDQNGRIAGVDSFPETVNAGLNNIADSVQTLVSENPGLVATLDTNNNLLSFTNVETGLRRSVDLELIAQPTGQQFGQTYSGPRGVPSQGLNLASYYSAAVLAAQQPTVVSTNNYDYDMEAMVAVALAEARSLARQQGVSITMETIANRAIVADKDIKSIVTASGQYQPVTEEARRVCGCKSPNQSHRNQALDNIIARERTTTAFNNNLAIANGLMQGTHVRGSITSSKLGHVDFANVPLTEKQGRTGVSSARSVAAVQAMKNDPESITLYSGVRGVEQTYGIRAGSRAPDFSPQTASFSPSSISNPDTRTTVTTTYSPETPNTTNNNVSSAPNTSNNTVTTSVGSQVGSAVGGALGSAVAGPVGGVIGGSLGTFVGSTIQMGLMLGTGGVNPNLNNGYNNDADIDTSCPYPIQGCLYGQSSSVIQALLGLFNNKNINITKVENEETQENSEEKYVTVLITVNDKLQEIEINRLDIVETLENPTLYYTEEQYQEVLELLNQTAILFNSTGEVIYSNGLYSPKVENGEMIADPETPKYIYVVEYIDENGDVVGGGNNTEVLNESLVTDIIRNVIGNNSPFYSSDLESVTHRLVDPNSTVFGDEYYDYVVTLKNGDTRAITVPEFASIKQIKERFAKIGYRDDVLALIQLSKESTEEPEKSLVGSIFDLVSGLLGNITNQAPAEVNTVLPLASNELGSDSVRSVFIYPITDIECPTDVPKYSDGFMYTATITDPENTDYVYMITDGRCGYGDQTDLATEIIDHLNKNYGISVNEDDIATKTQFIAEPTTYTPGVVRVYLPSSTPTTPTDTEVDTATSTTPVSTSTEPLPNLTNTILFEVKAVSSDDRVLADWVAAPEITISAGVQLYFRWEANDYQQCLLFLNDNGTYSLTAGNRAMVSGNTELEGFNVPERNATYRIECGGQRNNEFGVDVREINVVVR